MRLVRGVLIVASLFAIASACSIDQKSPTSNKRASAEQLGRDKLVASILTCGGGIFEYEGTDPASRYDYSVRDGAQILVSLGHRVGFERVSQLLKLGDDGHWMENQFEPDSYAMKDDANKTVKSAAYLLGQYARQYCIEHPFDTLQDTIDSLARQLQDTK